MEIKNDIGKETFKDKKETSVKYEQILEEDTDNPDFESMQNEQRTEDEIAITKLKDAITNTMASTEELDAPIKIPKELSGNNKILGILKSPDNHGKKTKWSWALQAIETLSFGEIQHHCGSICRKIEPGNHMHSPMYECKKCGNRFWTWVETG